MTKREKALECLKACVLALKSQDLSEPDKLKRWNEKSNDAVNQINSLSKEDKKLLEADWSKWLYGNFGKEIKEILLKH